MCCCNACFAQEHTASLETKPFSIRTEYFLHWVSYGWFSISLSKLVEAGNRWPSFGTPRWHRRSSVWRVIVEVVRFWWPLDSLISKHLRLFDLTTGHAWSDSLFRNCPYIIQQALSLSLSSIYIYIVECRHIYIKCAFLYIYIHIYIYTYIHIYIYCFAFGG